jgi:surface polysaccharide O-acyltransferase-like enzyme
MTLAVRVSADWLPARDAHASAGSRDQVIDTMRGIAILMVIGIHSLQQPLDTSWTVTIDAVLRPCVPLFLFASGYLTALSGRVPLAKRLKAALIPYAIAFAAAYLYMTLHNPVMDHRLIATVARFGLAYVFVYYYVFVYVGCTVGLWLVFGLFGAGAPEPKRRIAIVLILSIGFGLIVGSYLDPMLLRRGLSDSLIDEARMRDIPFWFSFTAVGALTAMYTGYADRGMRVVLFGSMLTAYLLYAAVRIFGIGDAAVYDSTAFFGYAALFCLWLFVLQPRTPLLAAIGSGSYFIYLWHIFIVMALRDHASLRQLGATLNFALTCSLTILLSLIALFAIRRFASPRVFRWLGA